MNQRRTLAATLLATMGLLGCAPHDRRVAVPAPAPTDQERAADPPRTIVHGPDGAVRAVFTDGAYSVRVVGPERRFAEATAAHAVLTGDRVYLLPAPFAGSVGADIERWLATVMRDRPADLLEIAMQYVADAPPVLDHQRQIAGDADYGPLDSDGQRAEGADFNDYLGVPWTYPDGTVDRPEHRQFRSLDCSGFVRMVWGFRGGLPLAPPGATVAGALPRRAAQLAAAAAVGVAISRAQLQAGDLLFFDADPGDGPAIDHVGIFLGRDQAGHERFLSSRKGANGPTLGDVRGASILDGAGHYARAFRSARRL